MEIGDLTGVKLSLLLHDPPNKMWVIKSKVRHEEEARKLAEMLLDGTSLKVLYVKTMLERENIVKKADIIASSVDRWMLIHKQGQAYYVNYDYLHNIFNTKLRTQIHSTEDVFEKTKVFAISLNSLLKDIEYMLGSSRIIDLYNAFYSLYEPLWYVQGLPPSLADTRAPTHTIFDHLYASASVANIVDDKGFNGYYVIVDYPSIQKLVFSGRKVGDFWASSWLLSNLVWGTGLEFAKTWGLDTILTPTPRLSPYTFKYIISIMTHQNPYIVFCPEKETSTEPYIVKTICQLARIIYGTESIADLNVLINQPLTPAYMTMLLPRTSANSPRELAIKVIKEFEKAWRKLYELVLDELDKKQDAFTPLHTFISKNVKQLSKVLEEPPSGPRIAIVDVRKTYEDLENCIVKGIEDKCRDLLLRPNRAIVDEIVKKIDNKKEIYEELISKILYHVLVVGGVKLAKVYGHVVTPLPRSFYYYDENSKGLVHLVEYSDPCTLCGEEPAVLKLNKTFRGRLLDYDDETLKMLKETSGFDEQNINELKKIVKPGEALGPYCLFKRATYLAFKERLRVLSTDDLALLRVSSVARKGVLNNIVRNAAKKFSAELSSRVGIQITDISSEILEALYRYEPAMRIKDIEGLAYLLKIPYEVFLELAQKVIKESCKELMKNKVEELSEIVLHDIYSIPPRSIKIKSELWKQYFKENTETLCSAITPIDSYVIVKGDADNVGRILSGKLPEDWLSEHYLHLYINEILSGLRKDAEITGNIARDTILRELEGSYKLLIDLVTEALGFNGVLVSPAWHASISLSLMLTAIEDYKITGKYDGQLIFTGGDDILVFYPVHTAFKAIEEHRLGFTGNGFKYIKIGGSDNREIPIPIASSLITGRSFSIRFANIKDIMSDEVINVHELLKNYAKKSTWTSEKTKWTKDSMVISDSRSNVIVVLPNLYELTLIPLHDNTTYKYIDLLIYALIADIISRGIPEDIVNYMNNKWGILGDRYRDILSYILTRNLKLHSHISPDKVTSIVLSFLGKLHKINGVIVDNKVNLAFELYTKLLLVLRRHIG